MKLLIAFLFYFLSLSLRSFDNLIRFSHVFEIVLISRRVFDGFTKVNCARVIRLQLDGMEKNRKKNEKKHLKTKLFHEIVHQHTSNSFCCFAQKQRKVD